MVQTPKIPQTQIPPIISIVGRSSVGKTTFAVKLIAELTLRGYRVGTIKHSVHGFAVAEPGRDTWKHAQAGAETVVFVTAHQLVLARSLESEPGIDDIAAMMGDLDLILTEGYKREHKPKVEVSRREMGTELVSRPDELLALVSDYAPDVDAPRFALDDAVGVADLICERYLA